MAYGLAADAAVMGERPRGEGDNLLTDQDATSTRGIGHGLVDEALVEAVYDDCCAFPVPGSERLEKIRIRRVLEAAAPRLVAAMHKGEPR